MFSNLSFGFESEMYIIIPTHKPKYLDKVLGGLRLQSYKNFKVIIVENPELTKEVRDLASEYNCNHIQSPIGANNARNTGVSFTDDYDDWVIALLDDDCIPDTDWTLNIYNAFKENKNISCIGGNVTLSTDKNLTALQAQYLTRINWGNTNPFRELQQGEYLASCNLAFKKSIYKNVGGFNANLGYLGKDNFIPNDEVLFIRDCANHGKVCYNDNMRVLHLINDRINKSFFLKRAYGQGYANILLEREQDITGNCHHERIYYSDFNKIDIDLQIAKHIGMLHAIKGIQPSNQFYSMIEELINGI
jgi:glycosyltransferase involved in cell wall biosynthesis